MTFPTQDMLNIMADIFDEVYIPVNPVLCSSAEDKTLAELVLINTASWKALRWLANE